MTIKEIEAPNRVKKSVSIVANIWKDLLERPFECRFAGEFKDIEALDFILNEAPLVPEIDVITDVWSNAIVTELQMEWLCMNNNIGKGGEYLIGYKRTGSPNFIVSPTNRFTEIFVRRNPQYGKIRLVTEIFCMELLALSDATLQAFQLAQEQLHPNRSEMFMHPIKYAMEEIKKRWPAEWYKVFSE